MSEGPRKYVGRWKSQKDIGRQNSRNYICREKQFGRLLAGCPWKDVGRRKIFENLRKKFVGGSIMIGGGGRLHFFRLYWRSEERIDNLFCLIPLEFSSEMMH